MRVCRWTYTHTHTHIHVPKSIQTASLLLTQKKFLALFSSSAHRWGQMFVLVTSCVYLTLPLGLFVYPSWVDFSLISCLTSIYAKQSQQKLESKKIMWLNCQATNDKGTLMVWDYRFQKTDGEEGEAMEVTRLSEGAGERAIPESGFFFFSIF